VRMFGSAIVGQALLSAMSFVVGLLLIRLTSDTQYGYYVLVTNAGLLLSALQNAFTQPAMVMQLARLEGKERADLIGGLFRDQRRLRRAALALSIAAVLVLWLAGVLPAALALLLASAACAVSAMLYRESFRVMLLAHRHSHDALKGDACYVFASLCGIPLATLAPAPAAVALAALGTAAFASGILMSRLLRRFQQWNEHDPPPVLRSLAPIGGWTATGSATHWAFSQGYTYVVAATLDVPAVAALAATRLLMMPVNLLSSGIISVMMPTAVSWLRAHGAAVLFRRLLLVSSALAAGATVYFALLWVARPFIFTHLMHKNFAHLDELLLLWPAVFLTMIFRDQLQYLPAACGLFRSMTLVTGAAAVLSLTSGYYALARIGVLGAPVGVLIGEVANVVGMVMLSIPQIRKPRQP
jgi:O-antigen/teichoic acid export membrane protein